MQSPNRGLVLTPANSTHGVVVAMRGTKSGAASRASADLRAVEATTGNVHFVPSDSKQVVALAGLEIADYFIQDEFFLKEGSNIGDGATSCKFSILDKVETSMLSKLFPGADASITLCSHGSCMDQVNATIKIVTKQVATVDRISFVLVEDMADEPPVFLTQALAVLANFEVNAGVLL